MAGNGWGWDDAAGTTKWRRPGEHILWRGQPRRVVVTAADVVLIPVSLYYLGFALFWVHSAWHADHGFAFLGLPVVLIGVYFVGVRFVVRAWVRRQTWYAVTDQRAVVVSRHGDRVRDVPLSVPMEVRRSRTRTRGSAVWQRWMVDQKAAGLGWPVAWQGPSAVVQTGMFDPRRRFRNVVGFTDVDGIDGLVAAATRAGFSVSEPSASRWSSFMGGPVPPEGRLRRSSTRGGAARAPTVPATIRTWVRTRVLRRSYQLSSPLSPDEVGRRLANNLVADRSFSVGGLGLGNSSSPMRGSVSGWNVRIAPRPAVNNSWTWVFQGGIFSDGDGALLSGMVGPNDFTPAFSVVWVAIVSIVLFIGVVSCFAAGVELALGHHPSTPIWPAVLVPFAMLAFFVGITEVGYRMAASTWSSADRWLHWLLEAPEDSGGLTLGSGPGGAPSPAAPFRPAPPPVAPPAPWPPHPGPPITGPNPPGVG